MPAFVLNRGQPNEVSASPKASPFVCHHFKLLWQSFRCFLFSFALLHIEHQEILQTSLSVQLRVQSVPVVLCRWRWTSRL